jgi:hypothetical protein
MGRSAPVIVLRSAHVITMLLLVHVMLRGETVPVIPSIIGIPTNF